MGKTGNWNGWTEQVVKELHAAGKIKGYRVISKKHNPVVPPGDKKPKKGAQKYGNEGMWWEGIYFRSVKERKRYIQLKFQEEQGIIRELRLQVPYELNPGGTFSRLYVADFVYIDVQTGKEFVEDSKGYRTAKYRKDKKLMLSIHGITIKET